MCSISICLRIVACLAAAGLVSGNLEVVTSTSTYSCCRSSKVTHQHGCENSWSIGSKNIGFVSLSGSYSECVPPCLKIEEAQITLDGCIDVNVTTVCLDNDVTVETRTCYYSQPCPESRSNSAGSLGSAGLLLLALGILLVLLKQTTC